MKKFGKFTEEEIQEKKHELPQWTQKYIQHLEYERDCLERQVREWQEEQTTSDISWAYLLENEHFIPAHSHIRFYHDEATLKHRAHIDVFFRNDGDRKVLEIQGSRGYSIEARASNSIYIIMEGNEELVKRIEARLEAEKEVSELQEGKG
jgi:hypothetical protein